MKRRLMLARALLNDPALLCSTSRRPASIRRRAGWSGSASARSSARGTTILLTTHYMEEAAQLCDRLIIMDDGRIVAEGRRRELIARHVGAEVVEVYLPDGADPAAVRGARSASGPVAQRARRARCSTSTCATARPTRSLGRLDGLDFTRRRATLEDVFLTLTGHALRD